MKKLFFLVSIMLSSIFSYANGGDDTKSVTGTTTTMSSSDMIKGGFGIRGSYTMYGNDLGISAFGAEISNQWYFVTQGPIGIGGIVNWLDFSSGSASNTENGITTTNAIIDLGIAEFGGLGTYAINDNMAVDATFTFRPTLLVNAITTSDDLIDGSFTGFGTTYAIGAGFRYQKLYAGLEANFGNIETTSADFGDITEEFNMRNFKLMLGFKF